MRNDRFQENFFLFLVTFSELRFSYVVVSSQTVRLGADILVLAKEEWEKFCLFKDPQGCSYGQ